MMGGEPTRLTRKRKRGFAGSRNFLPRHLSPFALLLYQRQFKIELALVRVFLLALVTLAGVGRAWEYIARTDVLLGVVDTIP